MYKTDLQSVYRENWLAKEGRWIISHHAGIVFLQHALMKLGSKYFI